jgi:hypothetical protein
MVPASARNFRFGHASSLCADVRTGCVVLVCCPEDGMYCSYIVMNRSISFHLHYFVSIYCLMCAHILA